MVSCKKENALMKINLQIKERNMEVKVYEDEREQQLKGNLSGVGVVWIFSVMFFIPVFLWIFMYFPSSYIELATGTWIYDNIYFSWATNTLGSILVLLYFARSFRLDGVDIRAIMGRREIPVKKILFYGVLFVIVKISIFVVVDYFSLPVSQDYYELDGKPFRYVLLFSLSTTLLTPVYEEFVMRGVLFNKLSERLSLKRSVIVIGVLFALLHGFAKGMVFIISGSAFYYAYIYHKTKSLYAPIFFHFVGNFIASLLDLLTYNVPDSAEDHMSKSAVMVSLVMLIICYPFVIRLFRTMWRDLDGKGESVYMHNVRELHGDTELEKVRES